jgi:hypothetical protein
MPSPKTLAVLQQENRNLINQLNGLVRQLEAHPVPSSVPDLAFLDRERIKRLIEELIEANRKG